MILMEQGITEIDERLISNLENIPIPDHDTPVPVLQIVSTLQIGGGENVVATLAQVLPADRYDIHVCCLHREGPLANVLRDKGVDVIWLNMRLRYWPISLFKLFRLMKDLNVQIVHTHLSPADFWGRVAAILAGVPVIVTTEHNQNLWRKWPQRIANRILNRYTNKIIAVSEDIRKLRIKLDCVSPKKVVTIPNAVDLERFRQVENRDQTREELGLNDSSVLIGTVTRLEYRKRIDRLLAVSEEVFDRTPEARFVIVGDGPLRNDLEAQAEKLALPPGYLHFLGRRMDVPDLLSAMDIFVSCSDFEGMPIAILEAMASGKPIVATKVGGVPEVLQDRYTGLLVSPNDLESMTEAIVELATDKQLREFLALNAFRIADQCYSTQLFSQRTSALYEALLLETNG
jgi:glycosyltransferase involved in cell wall biosynthesis